MSIVSNNIKYLRRLNGLTQEQFARKIAIKRSLLGAYEEARANPNLDNLKNMALAFGISVDQLLKNDLRKLRETPDMSLPLNNARPMTVSHSGPVSTPPRTQTFAEPQPLSKIIDKYQQPKQEIRTVARQVNLKPVNGEAPAPVSAPKPLQNAPTPKQPVQSAPAPQLVANLFNNAPLAQPVAQQLPVFNNQYSTSNNSLQGQLEINKTNYPTIQWVGKNQWNEYIAQYQNPVFLTQLPSFQLPNLPSGYYRAFESGADFIYPGSLLVGSFVRNWYEIQDGNHYVFVLRSQGIVYRKTYNQVKERGVLILHSDIDSIPTTEIALQDVLEVWEIKAFISLQMPVPQPSIDKIAQLMDEMYKELNQGK